MIYTSFLGPGPRVIQIALLLRSWQVLPGRSWALYGMGQYVLVQYGHILLPNLVEPLTHPIKPFPERSSPYFP